MDLDWCTENIINESQLFNDNSIIKQKTSDKSSSKYKGSPQNTLTHNKYKKELEANDCFNLNLDSTEKLKILEILNYLSFVSNNLRTIIRNKNLISGFDKDTYGDLIKYLVWLREACDKVKTYFICSKKRDNSIDGIFKPFKTSSYKFCNYKNSCSIHKNKNKTCDKNHFVFDMVLIDIDKLIESLEYITKDSLDYINWIFSDKWIKITIGDMETSDQIEQINTIENVNVESTNIYYVDKNVIFKCFDVISYVLNKMYEESITFLTYDIESYQINL
jgi:hypothetical protein